MSAITPLAGNENGKPVSWHSLRGLDGDKLVCDALMQQCLSETHETVLSVDL